MKLLLFTLLVIFTMGISSCHEGEWHWIQPEVLVELPTITPQVLPNETGDDFPEILPAEPCDVVKGNISSDGRRLYHTENSPNFDQVKIDESKGERWFCSEQEALDAGWVKAGG